MNDVAEWSPIISATDVPYPSSRLWWAMCGCIVVGFALTCVLVWEGRPAEIARRDNTTTDSDGCPGGAECGDVQSSAYGTILGISLTKWSIGFYLLTALVLIVTKYSYQLSLAPPLSLMLPVVTGIGVTAAIWCLVVMMLVLGQFCFWCLIIHAINLSMFVLSILYARDDWRCRQKMRWKAAVPALPSAPVKIHLALGLLLAVSQLFIMTQFHSQVAASDEVPVANNVLGISELPTLLLQPLPLDADADSDASIIWTSKGSHDAPFQLIVFSCPTCPKCGRLDTILTQLSKAHLKDLRIDVRFFPLWHSCNSSVSDPGANRQHQYACSLVRNALAVALAAPEQFDDYLTWMYDQGKSLTDKQARREAERRCGTAEIAEAMASDLLWQRFAMDMKLARRLNLSSVPQIYLVRGRLFGAVTADNLDKLLTQEFSWVPVRLTGGDQVWVAKHLVDNQWRTAQAMVRDGRYSKAVIEYRRTLALNPDASEVAMELAWLLATCRDDNVRDGQQALQHAKVARQSFSKQRSETTAESQHLTARIFDAMAAAEAELDNFEQAVQLARSAVDFYRRSDNEADADAAHARIELYQQNKKYRE